MDWLLARQDAIERKLAARQLSAGGLVFYDLSSSDFEGTDRAFNRPGPSAAPRGQVEANAVLPLPQVGLAVAAVARSQRAAQAAWME